ncbi:MAG: response regulator [Deltaproteobacteria bacterium]|nr:response regulator [Candidatus Anaeroferrophillus wilburensis]MBN2889198.1 response regulator [Deltaproteobacteria bacterium]
MPPFVSTHILDNRHLLIAGISLGYLLLLFAAAYYADRRKFQGRSIVANPTIYALSLAVYCSSWTYYGSVGEMANTGFKFLTIYLGPTLTAFSWWFILRKMIRITHENNITSIADFISSRYGKCPRLGALVTVIAIIGIMPYIALQLKAISTTFDILVHPVPLVVGVFAAPPMPGAYPIYQDTAFYISVVLAIFGGLFGARHLDASEKHEGMVAAVALESIVKLLAFFLVGLFVTYGMFDGFKDILTQIANHDLYKHLLLINTSRANSYQSWFTMIVLSMSAVMFLPRQFHMAVIENHREEHIKKAMCLFPLYLFLINLFVVPISFGGLLKIGGLSSTADTYVLTLPLLNSQLSLSVLAFIGGLSAATGMVVVSSVTLSTMLLNNLIMPLLLMFHVRADLSRWLIHVKRFGILLVIFLGYLFFRLFGESYMLVNMGLISFAAAIQFAPAIIGGLYWKGGTRYGAMSGISLGFVFWFYTLMVPSFVHSGWLPASILLEGPFHIWWLKPTELFGLVGFDFYSHALFWSMTTNVIAYLAFSLIGPQDEIDRRQAEKFVNVFRPTIDRFIREKRYANFPALSEIEKMMAKFIGREKANHSLIEFFGTPSYENKLDQMNDQERMQLAAQVERALAGSVGSSAARVICDNYMRTIGSEMEDVFDIFGKISLSLEASQDELQQRVKELSVLYEASRTISSSLDCNQVMENILDLLVEKFNVDNCSIRLLDEDGLLRIKRQRGLRPEFVKTAERQPTMECHSGECFLTGRVIYVPDAENISKPVSTNLITKQGIKSFVQAPIFSEQETIGVLTASSMKGKGYFSDKFIELFKTLAQQLGVAIENARLYDQLAVFNKELEVKVAERTIELENKSMQLEEANKELKEVDRLKSEFLANMSHELRTPMNSIIGYTQLLIDGVDGPVTEDQQSSLEKVERNAEHLLSLINDILDLSKIEAGKMVLNLQPIELGAVITDTLDTIAPLVEDKQLEFTTRVTDSLPAVMGDGEKLRQILINLLNNAIKFTDRNGQVSLKAEVWRGPVPAGLASDRSYLQLSIEDSGIGIKQEDMERLFGEFVQLDASASRKYGGTGLGLSITKRLVEMHHGTIWVESEYGKGSIFSFLIPFAEPVSLLPDGKPEVLESEYDTAGGSDRQPGDSVAAAVSCAPLSATDNKVIVTVAGDRENSRTLERYLTEAHFTAVPSFSLAEAIAKVKEMKPFLLVVDLYFYMSSGWELINSLKNAPETHDIPLILVSLQQQDQGLVIGPDDYLIKPLAKDDIVAEIRRVFDTNISGDVLVVDDEPLAVDLESKVLKEMGLKVRSAFSGQEAMAQLQAKPPGLVILDLMMPGIDGFQVAEYMKSESRLQNIPIIIVTAKDLDAREIEQLNGQVQKIIRKGSKMRDLLLAEVNKWFVLRGKCDGR